MACHVVSELRERLAALQAMASAEVTHAHLEAVLGAIAVAVAAAEAGRARLAGLRPEPGEVRDVVLAFLTDSRVKAGIVRASRLLGASVAQAAYELGNGSRVLAFDTPQGRRRVACRSLVSLLRA